MRINFQPAMARNIWPQNGGNLQVLSLTVTSRQVVGVEANNCKEITRREARARGGVSRRANAILLLDDGFSCTQIAKVLYIDDDTVRTWHKHYMSGGFDELETFDWQGGKPYLSEVQAGELTDFLDHSSR
jgi:transposase